MSFADLAGQRVDVASMRQPILLPAERIYVGKRREREKHLAALALRVINGWTWRRIGMVIGVTEGHACRVTKLAASALARISREINLDLAPSGQDDD